ncbi:MAG: hypothetical protein NBV65_11495, partial [Burkholderiaceae bacterium]|nr:hypothetical protein [Burkholderiaceae bacterium]
MDILFDGGRRRGTRNLRCYTPTKPAFYQKTNGRISNQQTSPASHAAHRSASITASSPFMSDLKIYNTLARDKETFTPIEPGKVRMYVC